MGSPPKGSRRDRRTIIPRLLGALEWKGRSIKPCLVHGDLREGNVDTELQTGNILLFDATSYYGHNEVDLGIWRSDRHYMQNPSYREEYQKHFPPSEPVEEWDDRYRLYCIKTQLMYSTHHPGSMVRESLVSRIPFSYGWECWLTTCRALANLEFLNRKYGHRSKFG